MSKRLPRRTHANAPVWQPVTVLAVGNGVAIFRCLMCGEVHFQDVDAATEAMMRADLDA